MSLHQTQISRNLIRIVRIQNELLQDVEITLFYILRNPQLGTRRSAILIQEYKSVQLIIYIVLKYFIQASPVLST